MTTNYERIAGTPEKLAEFIGSIEHRVASKCQIFTSLGICDGYCGEYKPQCEGAALDWLQEECDD